jgi:hypothetical protein
VPKAPRCRISARKAFVNHTLIAFGPYGLGQTRLAGSLAPCPAPGERDGENLGDKREVILEYQQVGNSVRVAAVDPETLIEVSIVGSASAGMEALKRTAIQKLEYVLAKKGAST